MKQYAGYIMVCSDCGLDRWMMVKPNFCPNCGSKQVSVVDIAKQQATARKKYWAKQKKT